MSYAEKHEVTVTTDATGVGVGYTPVVTGRIVSVSYSKAVSDSYTDGVDFDVTSDLTGQEIWNEDNVNASKQVAPRQPVHSTLGVAALYAAGGSAVLDDIYVVQERIKIAVAAGGATKTGTFTVVVA